MKFDSKRFFIILSIIIVLLVGARVYRRNVLFSGATYESRENILNEAATKGDNWKISKETKIENYIVSAAYSSDGYSSIAVFKPEKSGRYSLSTTHNAKNNNIISAYYRVDGKAYDILWFNGAQTEYAEIIYNVEGEELEPITFDTKDMPIIVIEAPVSGENSEYGYKATYYDADGNAY